jgi:large subunit ribosomal protein L30
MSAEKIASEKKTAGQRVVKPYNRTLHDGKKSGGTIKVKWVVSFIGCTDDMRQTIRGLGLRRMHQVVQRQDTPETRGMIHKVRHLVEVVD